MRWFVFACLLGICAPTWAQIVPSVDSDNPRMQTVEPVAGQEILLAALPGTDLTLVFPTNEEITMVELDRERLEYAIAPQRNAVILSPLFAGGLGKIDITTNSGSYRFAMRTGNDAMAAHVVEIESASVAQRELPPQQRAGFQQLPFRPSARPPQSAELWWSYRLDGKDAVRPVGIRDDGEKTYILFSPNQLLPAIFAINSAGDETLTNGYMRGSTFVLDQVWRILVFRIDGTKATARRNEQPDG